MLNGSSARGIGALPDRGDRGMVGGDASGISGGCVGLPNLHALGGQMIQFIRTRPGRKPQALVGPQDMPEEMAERSALLPGPITVAGSETG